MRKHSMTAIFAKWDRQLKAIQQVEWAKQTARIWAIQREREAQLKAEGE